MFSFIKRVLSAFAVALFGGLLFALPAGLVTQSVDRAIGFYVAGFFCILIFGLVTNRNFLRIVLRRPPKGRSDEYAISRPALITLGAIVVTAFLAVIAALMIPYMQQAERKASATSGLTEEDHRETALLPTPSTCLEFLKISEKPDRFYAHLNSVWFVVSSGTVFQEVSATESSNLREIGKDQEGLITILEQQLDSLESRCAEQPTAKFADISTQLFRSQAERDRQEQVEFRSGPDLTRFDTSVFDPAYKLQFFGRGSHFLTTGIPYFCGEYLALQDRNQWVKLFEAKVERFFSRNPESRATGIEQSNIRYLKATWPNAKWIAEKFESTVRYCDDNPLDLFEDIALSRITDSVQNPRMQLQY